MLQQVSEGRRDVWADDGTPVYNHANHHQSIENKQNTARPWFFNRCITKWVGAL